MADDKTYNGWTNYETWNVALWIGNEESSHHYWQERAQEAWDGAKADRTFTRQERAVLDLMNVLKEDFEEMAQNVMEDARQSATMWADLLGAALSEVNWHEIASHMIDNVNKE